MGKGKLSDMLDALLPAKKNFEEDCLSCGGRGVKVENIQIHKPCLSCGGRGLVPFVDNIIPKIKAPDMGDMTRYAERNAHILMSYIREQFSRVGIEVYVRLEFPNPGRGSIARGWEKRNTFDPFIEPADGNLEENLFIFPKKGK